MSAGPDLDTAVGDHLKLEAVLLGDALELVSEDIGIAVALIPVEKEVNADESLLGSGLNGGLRNNELGGFLVLDDSLERF